MTTLILTVGLIIVFATLTWLMFRNDNFGFGMLTTSVCALATIVALAFAGMIVFIVPSEINTFELHKKYIEIYDTDALQNAGLIKNKIELNQWLYKAQFNREQFGEWSYYPSVVLELEPIE